MLDIPAKSKKPTLYLRYFSPGHTENRIGFRRKHLFVFILLVFVLASFSQPTYSGSPDPPFQTASSRFEIADCPVKIPFGITVECGYLTVPEQHNQPDGKTIRLAVAIIKSEAPDPAPDPIVYLEGGPGGGAISSIGNRAYSRFDQSRDFILIDQRGTGFSEPKLDCPELDELDEFYLTVDKVLNDEEKLAHLVEQTRACHDRLIADGVNLSAYNSAESAADLNDLRLALGYDSWNLYGISYGTRLALTIMRDQPGGIRSVILDSVYPPEIDAYIEQTANADRAFKLLFADCAAQPDCHTTFPDLEKNFSDLIRQADSRSIEATVLDVNSGDPIHLKLEGDEVLGTFFRAFYAPSLIAGLPWTIEQALRKNYRPLGALASALAYESDFSTGMYYAIQCAEEVPFNSPTAVATAAQPYAWLGDFVQFEQTLAVCDAWSVDPAPAIEDEPVKSAIPTLILAGEFDPITPPAWAYQTAQSLGHRFVYEFPGLSHGVTTEMSCPGQIAANFIADPSREPVSDCLADMNGLDINTDFVSTSLFYDLTVIWFNKSNLLQYGILGSSTLVFITTFFLWPLILLIHRLIKGGSAYPLPAYAIAIVPPLASLFYLLFIVGFTVVMFYLVITDDFFYVFGGPPWIGPLLIIPFLIASLPLVWLLLFIPAWRGRYWFLLGRLYYLFFIVISISFTWLLWNWRFLHWQ